jgi:hypothetical protein
VEARKGRRKLFGIEILYELPIGIGMAVIGDGLAGWLGLQQTATLALVAALSYLGPSGSEVMLSKWYGKKIVGEYYAIRKALAAPTLFKPTSQQLCGRLPSSCRAILCQPVP